MNLIEQLGGYERAKRELELKEQNSVLQCCIAVTAEMIRDALLEYRRQHNIFEHGDYIVWLFDYEPSHLYTVKNITEKGYDYGNDWGWYGVLSNEGVGYNFRHATDEEIKAGRRLEVNQ